MEKDKKLLHRRTRAHFVTGVKRFLTAEEVGSKAKWLLALLILFMFGTNGLSVANSFVARSFMTAIENRNHAEFVRMAFFYAGVFAASTLVSVFYSFTEQLLGLLWRGWATRQQMFRYSNDRVYYGLKKKGKIGNPDQRIADDVRAFTTSTLSFLLMFLNSTFTMVAFSGVLWSISPVLFMVSVLYAAAGSSLTYLFGRPLVQLNYDQMDKEANFRSSMTYLRSNAESVALSRREGGLIQLGLKTLTDLIANYRHIISVNRNVNFFTTGYNWMIQIIPALLVAPLFIRGEVDFGVITQSGIAFSALVGAFSLIVTQFQSLTSYVATSQRLAALTEATETEKAKVLSPGTFALDLNRIAYEGVTLRSPRSGRVLVNELSVNVPHGLRVLVRGKDESARSALFQAVAGLWDISEGRIVRPPLDRVLMVAELPYLPPGTMRELLLKPWPEDEGPPESHLEAIKVPEEVMRETLRTLKIEGILAGFGEFDTRQHWENTLPLDEQQLLVLARVLLVRPRFVFLDRPGTALRPEQVDEVLALFQKHGISYVVFEDDHQITSLGHYDQVLELEGGGNWVLKPTEAAAEALASAGVKVPAKEQPGE